MKFILELCEMYTIGQIAYILFHEDHLLLMAYMIVCGVALAIKSVIRWGLAMAAAGVTA